MSMKQTFWELLDNYEVEIPIIQRDYAQGRSDTKAVQIRKSFVSNLHSMVINTDVTQDLDFIYGSVKRDKLILLDGQQRLTTLFLLHWYVSTGLGKSDEARRKLSKFLYETRVSSREFIDSLIKYSKEFSLIDIKNLSDSIKDTHWFFSVWCYDPTVQSMLSMLDELHQVFKSSLKDEKLWDKLICPEHPPITFHFLNMRDFSLTDELYIKMNARGKALTEFENFKAWLQKYCENNNDIAIPDHFWQSMDKKWTDFFWRLRDKGTYEIDDLFLRCFKSVALANLVQGITLPSKQLLPADDSLVFALRENVYIPVQVYVEKACFDGSTISELSQFLDLMHQLQTSDACSIKNDLWGQCSKVIKDVLREKGYLEQVRFYALFRFVVDKSTTSEWSENDLHELADWLGVALRLINNTIIDTSILYARAVQSLALLSKQLQSGVMQTLAAIEPKDIRYFREEQRMEEIRKAKLVVNDSNWRPLLKEFEQHGYFYGQIGFLLQASLDIKANEYSKDRFLEYATKASVLFSDELIETDDFLLQRALLAVGDYLIEDGSNYSFCMNTKTNARYRYENWRSVFNDSERVSYLFDLLDRIEIGREKEGLLNIVNNADIQDWRQYFISYPRTIAYCKKRQVRFDYDESGDIYLLNGLRMSGRHRGLKTYVLYMEIEKTTNPLLRELKSNLKPYYEVYGDEEAPGVLIEPWSGSQLSIKYNVDGFILKLSDVDKDIELDDSPEIIALKELMAAVHSIGQDSKGDHNTKESIDE